MFCTEEEFQRMKASNTADEFNEILSRVYNKAIESSLRHIPDMVNKLSKKVQHVNTVLADYFKVNPEFLDYKDVVLQTIQKVEIEFTGMLFEDVLEKSTPEIKRKIQNIKGASNG